MPKAVIAVVGGTGEGKSSLMNALLDHRSVLPTSGIRACTAVVVEVVQNTNKDVYEADIEFLQKKVFACFITFHYHLSKLFWLIFTKSRIYIEMCAL